MGISGKSARSGHTSSALAWVLLSLATVVLVGILCFYFVWAKAERERDAEYRQGWDYAGASQALKMYPYKPSAHVAMASVWMKQQQYSKAAAEYNLAVKLEPSNPYNHLDLGNALSQLGQTVAARKEWHTAATLDVPGGQAITEAVRRLDSNKPPTSP